MAPLPELQDEGQATDVAPHEDANQDLYESDEFRMYCYKVLPCAKRASHEWTSCPFSHPNEKARRRDPRIYKYLAIPCPDTKEGKTCPRGDDCPNCHSLFEYWLHPSRYRTQLCRNNDGSACRRQICFFAHSIEELRVPDHSHLNIPEELLQKQASLGSNDGSAAAAGDSSSQDGSSSGSHAGACEHKDDKAATAGTTSSSSKQRRASKASTSSAGRPSPSGRQCGAPSPAASSGGLVTTTSGSLPSNLDLPQLPPSPCAGPLTPMPLLSNNSSLAGPYASALHAGGGGYGASSWSAGAGPYLPRSASLDQQIYDGLSCFSAPGTPAAALRRGSLDLASCRTSVDLPPSGRCSAPRPGSFDLPPPAAAVHTSGLFSSHAMMGDPEVPDPCCSPSAAAMQQLKQQQMWALQQEQLEAAVGAALNYEQQVMQMQLNQQQQAAWFAGRAAAAAAMGEYAGPGGGGGGSSPPLSPAPSSVVGSRASLSADELFAGYSPAASSVGSSAAACWGPPPHGLPRTLSGPAGYQQHGSKGFAPGRTAFRYGSLDAPQVAAAAAAAAASSAAEVAGQVQMAALQRAASMGGGGPQYSMAAPLPPPPQQQQQRMHVGQGGEPISLAEVAQLVDSVNRGDLGEAGNQVLNGVISLLMQQLQHQQLAA